MPKNATILICDSQEVDIELLNKAIEINNVQNPIIFANQGKQAIQILEENKNVSFVILDNQLHNDDATTVLKFVKEDNSLKQIPVVIISDETEKDNTQKYYEIGANSVINRPTSLEEFDKAIKALIVYWTHVSRLPKVQ